jgi:hypothetical protein
VSPIAGAGGGDISKSAIRDPAVWAALTGTTGDDDMASYTDSMRVRADDVDEQQIGRPSPPPRPSPTNSPGGCRAERPPASDR